MWWQLVTKLSLICIHSWSITVNTDSRNPRACSWEHHTEYCLYFYKGKGKTFPQSYDDAKTYYLAPINHKDKKLYGHPTIKPLELVEKGIRNSSREDWIVFDPFMGSGTTGVACVNNGRNFIGVELNEEYFNIAKERIENN